MTSIKNLLKYLLKTPDSDFKYLWVLLTLFVITIIASFIIKYYLKKKKDKILKRLIKVYPARIIGFAIAGLILLFARSQEIMMLSTRILLLFDLGFLIYFIAYPIYLYQTKYINLVEKKDSQDARKKYLPKQKGKKNRKR
ncbi:hypothetical protein KKG71_03075 [Patescibacteria group bacterium]|nr:hypothetical protein [Patescibacteria group bacterium]